MIGVIPLNTFFVW